MFKQGSSLFIPRTMYNVFNGSFSQSREKRVLHRTRSTEWCSRVERRNPRSQPIKS